MKNSILGIIVSEAVRVALQEAEHEPPSYLPASPERHAAARILDICPDDAPHNPEACRDPACDCYPF